MKKEVKIKMTHKTNNYIWSINERCKKKKGNKYEMFMKIAFVGFWWEGKGNYWGGMIAKKKNHNQHENLRFLLAWKTHVYKRRKTLPPIIRINQNRIYCNLPTLQAFQNCKRIFLSKSVSLNCWENEQKGFSSKLSHEKKHSQFFYGHSKFDKNSEPYPPSHDKFSPQCYLQQ
jgi:hypothetical protein